jgi:HAD superfamily hydrolase (TIGR01509 family)
VRAVIYDCDGVLINSRASNAAFYNHILEKFGQPPLTPEQLDFVQVSTATQALDYLFAGSPNLAAAQAYQKTVDNRAFLPLLRLEPYVREVLARLRPRYQTAIATNRGKSLPQVLEHLGLSGLFDFTVTCHQVTRPKPHPECLLKVLDHFRLRPRQALYVGDAALDQEVARAAGVPFAAYRNPALKALYHLQDHRELLPLLGLE